MNLYLVLNLKRIFVKNRLMFWNQNQHGYTDDLKNAGIFTEYEIKKLGLENDDILINISENNFLKITKDDINLARQINQKSCMSVIIDLDSNLEGNYIMQVLRENFKDKLL